MTSETPFLRGLRLVCIHLIKHDQPHYESMTGILRAVDERRWAGLPAAEKLQRLGPLTAGISALQAYYDTYPHAWSRDRFAEFKQLLETYRAELQAET